MIKTVRQACRFNPIIQDYRMSQSIENLADLIKDAGDGQEFFSRNYVTHGMEQLFREGLLRLSGKSDQAVFELTQAMGGGKTHMMIALGLLARHPHLRESFLPNNLASRIEFGQARIAAFSGRNNPDNYIWGDIATQLGAAEAIKPYWVNGPKAVDQRVWKEIIGDEPTLILLDELPPYLDNASTQIFGQGTLANMVVYSLSSLMSAALELPNCAIVIANLSGSYKAQTKALADAISNLQQETRRQAMTITPVQLAGNEIYEILKKRLIDELPDERVVSDIAEEYAQQIKRAEDGGYIVASSIEQIAEQVRETYPFHPSFKHLVALFKENEGFRQTRGLMQFTARLLKSVDEREADDVFLIGTQHLNLNDDQVKDEIERIAPRLMPAVTRDIADQSNAIAESIDAELASDAAQQVMTLLLASSLSRAVGGRIGLSENELIEFLAAPQRKPDEFLLALQHLRESAWYLHREDQRFFIKETENLSRQIERNAREVPQPKVDQALINRLAGILAPARKIAYQDVQVLPKLDELRLGGSHTLIVIKPDGKMPPGELQNFFDFQQEKNNLLVLTGQDSVLADAVEERLRELYAIEQIHKRLKSGDTLFEEARDRFEEAEDRFSKALSAAYNCLSFPVNDITNNRDVLGKVTIDQGLKLGQGEQSAETQIEKLLSSPRADFKLVAELNKDNLNEYFAQAEEYLWPSGKDNRRTPWKDVATRAKCSPIWPWMPGASGLDTLKAEALKQGRWRLGEDGYIEKGPFPKDKATVNVSVVNVKPDTGETVLSLTPRYAGESPVVYWSTKPDVSEKDHKVDDLDNFGTVEGTLFFWVKDTTGQHESTAATRWLADLKIRHQIEPAADKRRVVLAATPRADLFYTLDGSNPKDGTRYNAPFEIGPASYRLLVFARAGEANKTADFQIPASGDKTVQIKDSKPARLQSKRVTLDTTDRVFGVINRFRDQPGTRFKGVRVEIGEGENTVTVRFQEREVTAAIIEGVVNSLREVLGEPEALINIAIADGVQFDTGFALKEFARLAGIELRPGDVSQEN
jgi:phenylpyruvate tautomerase PptA (4-oxalocrotonate tautomerase family)